MVTLKTMNRKRRDEKKERGERYQGEEGAVSQLERPLQAARAAKPARRKIDQPKDIDGEAARAARVVFLDQQGPQAAEYRIHNARLGTLEYRGGVLYLKRLSFGPPSVETVQDGLSDGVFISHLNTG